MSELARVHKTEAVILRRRDFGETDLLLTLYTPRHGKIGAIAKGARKPTARLTGQVELYACTELVLHRGRDLYIVTQAESGSDHAIFQEDLERSLYAGHFVELLDRFTFEQEENRPAYDLIVSGLNWLHEPELNLELLARYYEFMVLRVMGYEPSLFECVIGKEKLTAEGQFFSPGDGGVVCPDHAAGFHFPSLSLPVFKLLRHFSRHHWDAVKALQLENKHLEELERILHLYLIYLLERRLQNVSFLRKLQKNRL